MYILTSEHFRTYTFELYFHFCDPSVLKNQRNEWVYFLKLYLHYATINTYVNMRENYVHMRLKLRGMSTCCTGMIT